MACPGYHTIAVTADGDRITVTIVRPGPVPTRMKFRRRRFIRIAKATVRASLERYIGQSLREAGQTAIDTAVQTMRDVTARYAHLRK